MTALPITLDVNPATGKMQGSYIPVDAGINFIGTVGHGNIMTITAHEDTGISFGTRDIIKPLAVFLGDSRFGSSLGRITTEHISSNATSDTVVKAGALTSSWRLDLKEFGDDGFFSAPVTTQDRTKPLIQYIERRYGFDFDDPTIQNNKYYFKQWGDANTYTHEIDIDGRVYSHTNDGTAGSINNGAFVRDYIIDLINDDPLCKCTASVSDSRMWLQKKDMGQDFIVTYPIDAIEAISQNFNNKANRVYAWDNSTINDSILLTRSNTNAQSYMENTSGNLAMPYYVALPDVEEWMCEEFVLVNSSEPDISDGYYNHYKNAQCLNPTASFVTYNTGQQPLGRCFLSQMSNGPYGYWRADLPINIGYQCWDDEWKGIYLSDSDDIVEGTSLLVRQPQTAWVSNSVKFQQVYSLVNPSGAHVFLCTAKDTYTYLGQMGA